MCSVCCKQKTEQYGCMSVCRCGDHINVYRILITMNDQLRRLYFPIECSDSSALSAKPFYTGGRECMFRYGCCDTKCFFQTSTQFCQEKLHHIQHIMFESFNMHPKQSKERSYLSTMYCNYLIMTVT